VARVAAIQGASSSSSQIRTQVYTVHSSAAALSGSRPVQHQQQLRTYSHNSRVDADRPPSDRERSVLLLVVTWTLVGSSTPWRPGPWKYHKFQNRPMRSHERAPTTRPEASNGAMGDSKHSRNSWLSSPACTACRAGRQSEATTTVRGRQLVTLVPMKGRKCKESFSS